MRTNLTEAYRVEAESEAESGAGGVGGADIGVSERWDMN